MSINNINSSSFICNICRSSNNTLLFEKKGFPIVSCKNCNLVSTILPTNFDTHTIYDDSYFHGGQVDGYADYQSTEKILRSEFKSVLNKILTYFKNTENKTLLEIGSAYGYFLDEASKHFRTFGIEINKEGVELSNKRGLTVFEGELTDEILRKIGKLDVVVMLDVIEHLTDPLATMKKLFDAMNPEGIIVIVTGDHDSMLSKIMKQNWRLMTPPQHTFFFSSKTLQNLLIKAGFKIEDSRAPWKIIPLGLPFYQVGSRIGYRIKFLENINSVGIPVNLFDTVRVIAKK